MTNRKTSFWRNDRHHLIFLADRSRSVVPVCVEILPIHHRSIHHTVYIQLLYSHDMAATKDPQTLSVNMGVSASYLYSAYQGLRLPVPRDGTREHAGLQKNNNKKKNESKIGRVSLRFSFFRACRNFVRSDQVRELVGMEK